MPRITSCKGCPDRKDYGKCHDYCEKYHSQKQADLEAKKKYKQEHQGEMILNQYCSQRAIKNMKKKR